MPTPALNDTGLLSAGALPLGLDLAPDQVRVWLPSYLGVRLPYSSSAVSVASNALPASCAPIVEKASTVVVAALTVKLALGAAAIPPTSADSVVVCAS